ADGSLGSAITRWMSLSSSNFISTTCAVRENTVSSVGAMRDDSGRAPGVGRDRNCATVVWTGLKFTLPASGSLRVLTGQRSAPQVRRRDCQRTVVKEPADVFNRFPDVAALPPGYEQAV